MFRVLLIDDAVGDLANTKKAVEAPLPGHEYEITGVDGGNAADKGIEAFNTAKKGEKPFGLVVTDYDMNYKTAMDVLEKIRQIDGEVPIVIVSKDLHKSRLKDSVLRRSNSEGWRLTAFLSKNDIWSEKTNLAKTEFETIVRKAFEAAQTGKTNTISASTSNIISDLELPPARQHHNLRRRTNMVFAIPPMHKRLIL